MRTERGHKLIEIQGVQREQKQGKKIQIYNVHTEKRETAKLIRQDRKKVNNKRQRCKSERKANYTKRNGDTERKNVQKETIKMKSLSTATRQQKPQEGWECQNQQLSTLKFGFMEAEHQGRGRISLRNSCLALNKILICLSACCCESLVTHQTYISHCQRVW